MANAQPRSITSAKPFKIYAEKYLSLGWNPIPLPPGKKNPPPSGFTGHGRPMVSESQLDKWFSDDRDISKLSYSAEKANIGLRLNSVEVEGILFEIVGIDVDHHPEDKDDPKNGGPQLDLLETKYGSLPKTWTSSARDNGIAGIRFYLAPKGLQWRGDCGHLGPDIDIISKNYRFAAIFPSAHPGGSQYWWYPPGYAPDGETDSINRDKWGLIPDPKTLPLLPKRWVDFLTNDRMAETILPMDMSASNKQLTNWAVKNFAPKDNPCEYMTITVNSWKKKLDESAKSHNILTDAIYHLLKCGANEGHTGWVEVVKDFEAYYLSSVLGRQKRTNREAQKEIERSRFGCLRRLKGEAEKFQKDTGASFFKLDGCSCEQVRNSAGPMAKTDAADSNWGKVPHHEADDPDKYEMTDWGNAEHFRDLHHGNLFHVSDGNGGWLAWHEDHWSRYFDDGIARHLFRRVKRRQDQKALQLMANAQGAAGNNGAPPANALKRAVKYKAFAEASGSLSAVTRALGFASNSFENMKISQTQLDADRYALGVANGILKWATHDEVTSGATPLTLITTDVKERLITRNTGVEYIPFASQEAHSNPLVRKGFREFKTFLEKVQPDPKMRDYLQKLLGQTLLGENQEKIAIFLYGPTNTGKTTMLELMLASVGRDYGMMQNASLYAPKALNPALGDAIPMRIVGTDELGANKIASDLFKTITGNATLTVEYKNSNQLYSDRAQFTPIISTNSPPVVPNEDDAFRGRIVTIPFEQNLKSRKGDREQSRLYQDGRTACLAWLVEGCTQAINDGIRPFPSVVAAATTEFNSQLSEIGVFIKDWIERVDSDEDTFVSNADIKQHYDIWASENGIEFKYRLSSIALSKRLISHNFRVAKPRKINGKVLKGFAGMKLTGSKIAEQIEGTGP